MTERTPARRALWAVVAAGAAALLLVASWALVTLLALASSIDECLSNEGQCQKLAEQRSEETRSLLVAVNVATIVCIQREPAPVSTADLLDCVEKEIGRAPLSKRSVPTTRD